MPQQKRPSDDSSTTSGKKQKKSVRDGVLDEVVQEADRTLNLIAIIKQDIERYAGNTREHLAVVACWRLSCVMAKDRGYMWTREVRAMLDMRLPNDDPTFRIYNLQYERFSKIQKANLSYLPAPSDFAQKWSQYQLNPEARLLCLRPPDARGLPLCTLHDIFRRYLLAAQEPLPQASDTAIAAMKSAAQLCASMGRSFSTKSNEGNVAQNTRDLKENARTLEFDDCIRGIVDGFEKWYRLAATSDVHSCVVGGALLVEGILISLCEMTADPGAGGDPYMQIARSYDLAVKVLHDRGAEAFLKQGAPMFLLCVIGPMLLVAGGFHDGDRVIVEPLGDICIMFEDYTNARREKLARVLYALAKGISELKELVVQKSTISSPIFPPFTPRIYTSCMLYRPLGPHNQGHLAFTDKLDFTNCNRLLFTATLTIPSSLPIPVLVKLVSGHYGEEVHLLLAEHDLAPTLHAYSGPEGAPKAYIMEYLQPSSWKTLFDFSALPNASTSAAAIRRSIDRVLDILENSGKVHGDLRSVNIMINVSHAGEAILVNDDPGSCRANIKVVDFDWAGDTGKVCYPPLRNSDIDDITWPGKPGGPIEQGYDRSLVCSWWPRSTFGQVV
ncbi:hypothetical protein NLJ89_g2845 [Agrocybe chaxingu]|uniref:Uncharacterized protein n=1 Tax=Agrocybe chaxingu TaxID=84603 RepID=A0A9W8MW27_9AGAR|nr:hypothetical protein NLJ89_g2845 [Agrocybe chaxingu]